ncbi:MAG: 4Fe-4S dicluster domain-containing protein [candidate division WOR-3 bacterium]
MKGILKVTDRNPEQKIRELCANWLRSEKLSGLLLPAWSPAGAATLALITDPQKVGDTSPLLPAMAVNAASVVHRLARSGTIAQRVGLLLRPCESRGVVELIKLRQVLPDNLVLIGIDCAGTYKSAGFRNIRGDNADFANGHVRNQTALAANPNLRPACQLCEYPRPLVFDLAIGWLGMNPDKELWLEAATDKGKALLDGVELTPAEEPESRQRTFAELVEKRRQAVAARLAELDKAVMGAENLVRYFADCLNCHNCMRVCPVCYCHECFFDSTTFQRDIDEHVRIAQRKGLNRMPSDTLLFHLTRMNHMMTSCVQCGICEDSCPAGIGLTALFKKVSRNAQAEFDYVSGRSLDEPLPLTTFREDEFQTIGEA